MQVYARVHAAHLPFSVKPIVELFHATLTCFSTGRAYRPEKHYMRGPGPKCREKAARVASPAADAGERAAGIVAPVSGFAGAV